MEAIKSAVFSLDGREELVDNIVKFFNKNNTSDDTLIKGEITIRKYSDGEISTQYTESIRGKRVYLVCSPINSDLIMTLNLAIDAAKRASAKEIIPVLPFYPYCRQDKKDVRGPIGAKVMAEMLEHRGATDVILFDLHADQVQGFFNIPVTHMEGKYLFDDYIVKLINKHKDVVLCSPDAGGVKRTKHLKDRIVEKYDKYISYVTIDKTRKEANVVSDMVLIGDVKNKHVVIVDDIIDTFGTIAKAASHIIDSGALSVRAIASHAILSGPAYERLNDSVLTELVVSDSISIPKMVNIGREELFITEDRIKVISIADQISRVIIGITNNRSVESLKAK